MSDACEHRKARRLWPVPLAIGLLVALVLPTTAVLGQAPARAITSVCPASWNALDVPGVTDLRGQLSGVDAAGASDAWAVGERRPTEGIRSLALHWDGETWTHHPVPNDLGHLDRLSSVAAIGPGQAWAVGVDIDDSGTLPDRSLVVRWTGDGWERLPSPNAGTAPDDNGTLLGVTSLAADDAWAVGSYRDPAPQPLTLHWNGAAWTVVATPLPSDAEAAWLNAVSGTGPDDVWAVGGTIRLADSTRQPLALHWDGTTWTQHPLPVEADDESDLLDVVALGPDEVWAVGFDDLSALRLRWDGTSWQRTPATAGIAHYSGVAAVGPSNAWTVGARLVRPADEVRTLTERYDGRSWIDRPGPVVEPIEERLEDVAALVGEQWAVGSSFRPFAPGSETYELVPLIARRCGFYDVAGTTHEAGIAAVTNAGIAKGYPDGTFRPQAALSRGQMATLLTSALDLPASEHHFTDVAGTTHEAGIAAVTTAGIAKGYPDRTFRPQAALSRGQMATLLDNALLE
jgi:hypothetical protein